MPRSVASDLVSHCFANVPLKDARFIWVKLPAVCKAKTLIRLCRCQADLSLHSSVHS